MPDNTPYRWTTDQLTAMATLATVNNSQLKHEDPAGSEERVRVFYLPDDGNPNPYTNTGMIERANPDPESSAHRMPGEPAHRVSYVYWYVSEYYNTDNPHQYHPGEFAHNFETTD